MAEFLTVNLGTVIKNQRSWADREFNSAPAEKDISKSESELHNISDWGKELQDRLEANNKLEANDRVSDYKIEEQFFEDFFTHGDASWDSNTAELLKGLGEPLKKAIKVLGFDRDENPILGFITDDDVIKNLLTTKLLNVNTFKAIYNAVAKKLVADSEFLVANDYNIIYCQDLYRRSASDMMEYLSIQKNTLNPSASAYTKVDQERNKKIFFYIPSIKELDPERRAKEIAALSTDTVLPLATATSTKLNSIEMVQEVSGLRSNNKSEDENEESNSNTSTANTVASKLAGSPAQAFAAIQYLSANTDAPEAKAALKHEAFKSVSMEAFIAESVKVAQLMKKVDLPKAEVKQFIALLLGRLERTV